MFVVYLNIASFVVAAPMAFYDSDKNRDGHLDYDRQQSSHIGMITKNRLDYIRQQLDYMRQQSSHYTSLTAKDTNLNGRLDTFTVKSVPNHHYYGNQLFNNAYPAMNNNIKGYDNGIGSAFYGQNNVFQSQKLYGKQ